MALSLALSVAACGQSYTPANVVEDLRILAIRAEPPELRPGESATLTSLTADPKGEGRAVLQAWGICTPPGAFTDLLLCLDERNVAPVGLGESVRVTAPPDFLDSGPRGSVQQRVLLVALGVQAGDEQRIGFKELLVTREMRPLNRNPKLTGAAFYARVADGGPEGAALTALPVRGEATALATFDRSLVETYTDADGIARTEDMQVSWFTTLGQFDVNRGIAPKLDNLWKGPEEPGNAQLWVVLRDGREGADWLTFTLPVREAAAP